VFAGTVHPVGTTLIFPDAGGIKVYVTLVKVVNNAPPKTRYVGLSGHAPVVALEFLVQNKGTRAAPLNLFSTVLYYRGTAAATSQTVGATKLGPTLKLTPLAPGSHRLGWVTTQGSKKSLQKVQSTLDGTTLGSWKP
jgi:hypothetical protein